MIIADQQRFVIGNELGQQADDEQEKKNPERPVPSPIALEIPPTPLIDRVQRHSRLMVRNSNVPGLEIDPGVHEHVGQIADQLQDQTQKGKDVQGAEHDRIIPLNSRLESQQSQSVQ